MFIKQDTYRTHFSLSDLKLQVLGKVAEHFKMADGNQQWNTTRTNQVEELKYKPDNAKTSKSKSSAKFFYFYKFTEIIFVIHLISLRRGSAVSRLLWLWVRIPSGAWMSVSLCCCCVLSGRGLWFRLITRPEESYRLCVCVCVCVSVIVKPR